MSIWNSQKLIEVLALGDFEEVPVFLLKPGDLVKIRSVEYSYSRHSYRYGDATKTLIPECAYRNIKEARRYERAYRIAIDDILTVVKVGKLRHPDIQDLYYIKVLHDGRTVYVMCNYNGSNYGPGGYNDYKTQILKMKL
jgi:hypothetical protein